MNDADLAVKLWEQYAPIHRLNLEWVGDAADGAYEAHALDDAKECWITVARARSMTDAMMMAATRVKDMRPGGPITEYDDEVVGPADLNTEHWDEYRRAKEEGRLTLEQLHRIPARLRDCPSPWHDEPHGIHSSCPSCSGTKSRRQ